MKVRNYLNIKNGTQETHSDIKRNNPDATVAELYLLSCLVVGEDYANTWRYLGMVDKKEEV